MLSAILVSLLIAQQPPAKDTLPGASNVTRIDATVLCGGATTTAAYPELKKRGFTSVVNLRGEHEPGANIAGSKTAAAAAGLKFIHIPIDANSISDADVHAFLTAVSEKGNQPVYIHCASANRVGAMWLIKRVVVDGWDVPKATEEAVAIGLTHEGLKQFAVDYATKHKKQ